jgi:hypothetical protein
MPSHFNTYVANFNRVRLGELIDYHETQMRMSRARASLVVNPLSRQFYGNSDASKVLVLGIAAN